MMGHNAINNIFRTVSICMLAHYYCLTKPQDHLKFLLHNEFRSKEKKKKGRRKDCLFHIVNTKTSIAF